MLRSPRLRDDSYWSLFLLGVATHFTIVYNWRNSPYLDLQMYADGQAKLPFQYRILMSWILRVAARSHLMIAAGRHLPKEFPQGAFGFATTLAVFFSVIACVVATRFSIAKLTSDRAFARWASFLIVGMAYFNFPLVFGISYTLPYDLPSLALFSIGISLLLYRRWFFYYLVFILGTLNRETFCFMTVAFAAWCWVALRDRPAVQRLLVIGPHVVAQVAIWLAIKSWLHARFLGNPTEEDGNGIFVFQLPRNLHLLIHPAHWILFFSLFGFLWIPLFLGRRWIKNDGLSLICASVIPLWVGAMFLIGFIVEVRIFSELAALLSLVAALEIYNKWFSHFHIPRDDKAAIGA